VTVNAAGFALAGWLGWCLLPLTLWVTAFFRDPERTPPTGENLVLSPADGWLLPVVMALPPPELGLGSEPRLRLSVFMTIFNVHVNRIPCDGIVTALAYRPGKFFNASFDKASVDNERMSIRMQAKIPGGETMELVVVQIAGLIARRIQCGLQEGQNVCRGDRFGIIRFGSRLEVFLPPGSRVVVRAGQAVRAGETILAEFPS
jgi:phosphatidylserine decarboxylase